MNPVLELRDAHRRYGSGATEVVALRGVDFAVAPGELVAVMGPSGSGKSTLLNLAGGLDIASAGAVIVDGVDVATLSASGLAALRRTHVGIVFQELNLLPMLTAVENVMLPLELGGSSAKAARGAARSALTLVGLSDKCDRYPDDLSGGEQQRVAIARAVVGDRPLVLADEPTGALDTTTGDRIIELLADRAATGTAVVLVTHEPRIASWADRVVWLRDGAVVDEVSATPPAAVPS
jgi:putative ABC transport system ATP-binding protein